MYSMVEYYKPPDVKITVGGKQYDLPKKLLCYCSTFFKSAFTGQFLEGEKQEFTLETTSNISFEMAINWMFTSNVIFPATVKTDSEKISEVLSFFKLADFLVLLSPYSDVI